MFCDDTEPDGMTYQSARGNSEDYKPKEPL